jgi:hypothetical protein
MEKDIPVRKVRKFLSPQRNIDIMRIYYCYQIGSTFVNLGLMENTIIQAMAMCDRIELSKALQDDAPAWQRIVERHSQLQSSTLGNLIAIMSKHGIGQADLTYLKWVKDKRDFFVHRFFHDEPWPGDLSEGSIRVLCRRLLYLEHVFNRAGNRIWKIFGRAGLMEYHDLGEDGAVVMNVGTLVGEGESWLKELALAEVRRHARDRRGRE